MDYLPRGAAGFFSSLEEDPVRELEEELSERVVFRSAGGATFCGALGVAGLLTLDGVVCCCGTGVLEGVT